jgi:hypothetical protein
MKKPVSTSLYNDVCETLDKVLAQNKEATLTFPSEAVAHVWMHRANRLRMALRQRDETMKGGLPGTGRSPYDSLMFSKRGKNIVIKWRATPATIQFNETPLTEDPYGDL